MILTNSQRTKQDIPPKKTVHSYFKPLCWCNFVKKIRNKIMLSLSIKVLKTLVNPKIHFRAFLRQKISKKSKHQFVIKLKN